MPGRQAYIIYPLVEESEKIDLKSATEMADHLQAEMFPAYRVALLHGRMKQDAKDRVMQAFMSGAVQILVSTTVVEVGVDVPNASVMVVEHAERFGLSQLHQLRGRVGRGEWESHCILLYQAPWTDDARERLKAMAETSDGASRRHRRGGPRGAAPARPIAHAAGDGVAHDLRVEVEERGDDDLRRHRAHRRRPRRRSSRRTPMTPSAS